MFRDRFSAGAAGVALILLRHTRPEGGAGVCYGVTDLAPGPEWRREARRLAAQLPPFARIASSPLTRCLTLARALATARNVPLTTDPRLAEIDFGIWEGRRWDDLPRDQIDAWAADLMGARPHGGESVRMLETRVGPALDDYEADGALLVTHMGVIRAALARAGRDGAWETRLGFAEWVTL
jgi:alpha-ribazole phosphatase